VRCLIVIHALAAFAAADDVLLHEERVWRGVVEARTEGDGEVHEERVEFSLVTRPPKRTVVAARLPFLMRGGRGSYSFELKRKDDDGVFKKGRGGGRLHPRVGGWVQPDGRYSVELTVQPKRAIARTTMAGMWEGRYRTWRTLTVRPCLLIDQTFEGKAKGGKDGDAFRLAGEHTFLQKGVTTRKVTVTWRIERIDPVLRGLVTDHHGTPVAGLTVIATTTNPARARRGLPPLRREGKTNETGRFALPAFHAPWTVRVRGELKERIVYAPARRGVELTPEASPSVRFELPAYALARLPRPRLLLRHFQRDVHAYLDYMKVRVTQRRLEAALAPPREREVAAEPGGEDG